MRDYKNYKIRRANRGDGGNRLRLISRLFKGGVLLGGILSLLLGARYSYGKLLTADYFALSEIVVAGEKRVKRHEIIALSGIKMNENVMSLDLKEITRRVGTQPWIETATVRRVLPNGISIEVKERDPFVILKADTLYYLDRSGTPFKELSSGDDTRYPVLTGLSKAGIEKDELARDAVMRALDFIENDAAAWPTELPITEIFISRNQGITVLSGDIEVRIGFGEHNLKLARLKKVLNDLAYRGRKAGHIDLTYTGQLVVR